MSTAANILEALACSNPSCKCQAALKAGKGDTHCPTHNDSNPSLSVNQTKSVVLVHCQAGCSQSEVIHELQQRGLWASKSKEVAWYDYGEGDQAYQVVRFEPKDFKQRRPDGHGGWIWKVKGFVEPTLYRLPELRAADADQFVFVPEGEKDVEALRAWGQVATCNSGGATRFPEPKGVELANRRVVILPDQDDEGAEHEAQLLHVIGPHAREIRIVNLPGAKDISEWAAQGHTVVELDQLVNATAPWAAPSVSVGGNELPPPSEPMQVARQLVDARYTELSTMTLRWWRTSWWGWRGSKWSELPVDTVKKDAYHFTEHAVYVGSGGKVIPWSPTKSKIANLLEALAAVTHTEADEMPSWLRNENHPADEIVAAANGLLHVPTRTFLEHTPDYFNQVAVPFDFDLQAAAPNRWLEFLDDLWAGDREAKEALQEFFGYVISGRIDLHKILLLIGPTRAGKGVVGRVLKALVGRGSHCGPTLASLGTNFGLSPLIGKPLGIISDARLGTRDTYQVVERLLSISGEDMLTIDRKYREPWTGTLPTRFLVISNELPRFGDASGAIANRFIVLTLSQSWLGQENPNLTNELLTELPGIFNWALDGLARLTKNGRFTEPQSSIDAVVALQDLVSPVSAFVRDRCNRGAHEVSVDALWAAWKSWAETNGHRFGSKQSFGRDLRAVVPGLRVVNPREAGVQVRHYLGISLKLEFEVVVRSGRFMGTFRAA